MANYNLTGQKIKNTYGQLAQVSGSTLVDGLGNETQIVTGSIVNFPTEVSRSAAAAGFGAGGGGVSEAVFGAYTSSNDSRVDSLTAATSSYLTSLPSGIVSGAAQLPEIGQNTTDIASLTAATSSYLTSLPSGVVSGSSQVDLSLATGVAANATNATNADNIALSADSTNTNRYVSFTGTANGDGTLLTDAGLLYNSFSNTLTTTTVVANVTGDLTGNADTATSATNATSASYAVTASYALNAAGGGAGLVAGTGTDSMKSSDDLTTTNAVSSYQSTIALGNNAQATSPYAIAIGDGAYNQNADGNRSNYIAIGRNANSSTDGIAIGYGAQARGSSNIVLGKSADATGFAAITIGNDTSLNDATRGILIGHNGSVNSGTSDAIVIGYNQSTTYTNEINIGGQIKYNDDNTGAVSFESAVRVDTTTLTGAGSTVSVDGSTSNYFYLNNAGSTTTIANPTNLQDGATYTFKIDDGRNITWSAAFKWPNGVVPTLSSGSDVISFVSIGGTNLYGTAQYNYQ